MTDREHMYRNWIAHAKANAGAIHISMFGTVSIEIKDEYNSHVTLYSYVTGPRGELAMRLAKEYDLRVVDWRAHG